MIHRAWPVSLAAMLSLTLGNSLAQPRSALTGITLPGVARANTNAAQLRQATAHLNSVARAHKLPGQCQKVEAFTIQLDDDAVDDFEAGFLKAGYAVKDLPSDSDDEISFTLRKGQQTMVATIAFGDNTVLAWCTYEPVNAGAAPVPRIATLPAARLPAPTTRPPASTTPAATGTGRLPAGRYVCSTNIGSFPNMQFMILGELQLRADGTYQGVRHGGGGPVARYTYNPGTRAISWTGGVGTNFGTLKESSYVTPANGRPHINIQYQSTVGGYTNTMTCHREGL